MREEKQKLDFEHNILKRKMDDIDEHYRKPNFFNLLGKLLDLKNKEYDAEKVELNDKIKILEGKLDNIDSFIAKKVI